MAASSCSSPPPPLLGSRQPHGADASGATPQLAVELERAAHLPRVVQRNTTIASAVTLTCPHFIVGNWALIRWGHFPCSEVMAREVNSGRLPLASMLLALAWRPALELCLAFLPRVDRGVPKRSPWQRDGATCIAPQRQGGITLHCVLRA